MPPPPCSGGSTRGEPQAKGGRARGAPRAGKAHAGRGAGLRELAEHEGEALGEVGLPHALELLGRREAELDEVVWHRLADRTGVGSGVEVAEVEVAEVAEVGVDKEGAAKEEVGWCPARLVVLGVDVRDELDERVLEVLADEAGTGR